MNAASANKEGAWDFLEFLLSRELQDDIDWGFPARADSLEVQLAAEGKSDGGEMFRPSEEETAALRGMLDSAIYAAANDDVWSILSEEAEMYFAGDATLDTTVKKIQNRMELYLKELGE